MKYKITLYGLIVGLISGLVVSSLSPWSYDINQVFIGWLDYIKFYGVGAIFGAFTGLFFIKYNTNYKKVWSYIFWIIVSTLSYALAAIATIIMSIQDTSLIFLIGGLVGAAILVIGYRFIFNKISMPLSLLIIVAGGIIGYLAIKIFGEQSKLLFILLYIIWQTVITGLLASSIKNELE